MRTAAFATAVFQASLFCGLFLIRSAAGAEPARTPLEDLALVKARMLKELVGAEPDSPGAKSLVAQARALADKLTAEGTWPDIRYADDRVTAEWDVARHLDRMTVLARARRLDAADQEVKAAALRALDHWVLKRYINPNWYWNLIGTPTRIGDIALLLDEDLSDGQRRGAVEVLKRARYYGLDGANMAWTAAVFVRRALLTGDVDMAEDAFGALQRTIPPSLSDGIQPDNSYLFHSSVLFMGSYGLAHSGTAARFAELAQGTAFAFPKVRLETLADFMLDGQCWVVRGDTFDYGVIGRGVASRHRHTAGELAGACRRMARLLPERREKLTRAADWLTAGKPGAEGEPGGNRMFWRSAFMVHRRPEYYFSIRMSRSDLRITDDFIAGQGAASLYLSDGVTFLLRRGDEYQEALGVWDWRRPPGVTNRADAPFPENQYRPKGLRGFAGGASDGTYGVAAMDWASPDHKADEYPKGHLRARKAWFCFDREIVCLGTGIACDGDHPVITSVNQCLLRGKVTTSGGEKVPGGGDLDGPAWVHHDGAAYYFPEKARVHLAAGPQTGSWWTADRNQPKTEQTLGVFSLWIPHGTGPRDAGYIYHVLPSASAEEMAAYAARNEVEVLSNTAHLQAVRHKGLGVVGAVFYRPGGLKAEGLDLSVDESCIVLARRGADGKCRLSVSKPAAAAEVRLNGQNAAVEFKPGGTWGRPVEAVVGGD